MGFTFILNFTRLWIDADFLRLVGGGSKSEAFAFADDLIE